MRLSSFHHRLRSLAMCAGVGFLLAAGMTAPAAADVMDPNYTVPLLPYRGMYYTPGHGGTGLTVDVDKNGYVFAVFYTYDSEGRPFYYLMEGQYHPTSEQERMDTGIIGTLDAPAYISENGECVGAGCTYQSPDRSDAHLPAHMEWTAPRMLHLTLGDQSWDIRGGQYTVDDGENLVGAWLWNTWGVNVMTNEPFYEAFACNIKHAHPMYQTSDFPPARRDSQGRVLQGADVPNDATLYQIACDGVYRGENNFIWYQASSGRMGFLTVTFVNGYQIPSDPSRVFPHATLYADGPQTIRGRFDFGNKFGYESNGGLTLVRMPSF